MRIGNEEQIQQMHWPVKLSLAPTPIPTYKRKSAFISCKRKSGYRSCRLHCEITRSPGLEGTSLSVTPSPPLSPRQGLVPRALSAVQAKLVDETSRVICSRFQREPWEPLPRCISAYMVHTLSSLSAIQILFGFEKYCFFSVFEKLTLLLRSPPLRDGDEAA